MYIHTCIYIHVCVSYVMLNDFWVTRIYRVLFEQFTVPGTGSVFQVFRVLYYKFWFSTWQQLSLRLKIKIFRFAISHYVTTITITCWIINITLSLCDDKTPNQYQVSCLVKYWYQVIPGINTRSINYLVSGIIQQYRSRMRNDNPDQLINV